MPVEGGRSSSFLTASATVPVSWLELGHVSSHRPSPPACETPYAALVRDHASTPAPPKGSASCTRRPSIESAAVKSALRGEHGGAQPVAVVADGVEVAAIRIAQRRQDEIVGVLPRSLLPASRIRFRPSRPLLAVSPDAAPSVALPDMALADFVPASQSLTANAETVPGRAPPHRASGPPDRRK